MNTLVIATRNQHKVREIRSMLPQNVGCLCLRDFPNAPEVVEDASTFAGNATKKAVQLARWLSQSGLPEVNPQSWYVLADDSGLEVDALGGAPGVHSARFAALHGGLGSSQNSPDASNNAVLLKLLEGVPTERRTARFRCVLALVPVVECRPKASSPTCEADEFEFQVRLFEGTCEGHLATAPSGTGGFGYDPLFIPTGHNLSFAELGEITKNSMSHRARALAKLRMVFGQ